MCEATVCQEGNAKQQFFLSRARGSRKRWRSIHYGKQHKQQTKKPSKPKNTTNFLGCQCKHSCAIPLDPPKVKAAVLGQYDFFLLVAAWVNPGRSALQSAEERCQRRYGRKHQMMLYIIKVIQKHAKRPQSSNKKHHPPNREANVYRRGLRWNPKESTYAGGWRCIDT